MNLPGSRICVIADSEVLLWGTLLCSAPKKGFDSLAVIWWKIFFTCNGVVRSSGGRKLN